MLVPFNVLFAIVFALSDTVFTAFCVASFVFLAIFAVIFFVLDFKLDVTSSNFLVSLIFLIPFYKISYICSTYFLYKNSKTAKTALLKNLTFLDQSYFIFILIQH